MPACNLFLPKTKNKIMMMTSYYDYDVMNHLIKLLEKFLQGSLHITRKIWILESIVFVFHIRICFLHKNSVKSNSTNFDFSTLKFNDIISIQQNLNRPIYIYIKNPVQNNERKFFLSLSPSKIQTVSYLV